MTWSKRLTLLEECFGLRPRHANFWMDQWVFYLIQSRGISVKAQNQNITTWRISMSGPKGLKGQQKDIQPLANGLPNSFFASKDGLRRENAEVQRFKWCVSVKAGKPGYTTVCSVTASSAFSPVTHILISVGFSLIIDLSVQIKTSLLTQTSCLLLFVKLKCPI